MLEDSANILNVEILIEPDKIGLTTSLLECSNKLAKLNLPDLQTKLIYIQRAHKYIS
jgi:hypothetical protein